MLSTPLRYPDKWSLYLSFFLSMGHGCVAWRAGTTTLCHIRLYSPSQVLRIWLQITEHRSRPAGHQAKGTGSREEYFLRHIIKYICTLCPCAAGLKYLDCPWLKRKVIERFSLLLWKLLLILRRKPHNNFCTGFPLCHWSIFFSVHPSFGAGKICVSTSARQLPDDTVFQNYRRFQGHEIGASEPLKIVTGRIFRISK